MPDPIKFSAPDGTIYTWSKPEPPTQADVDAIVSYHNQTHGGGGNQSSFAAPPSSYSPSGNAQSMSYQNKYTGYADDAARRHGVDPALLRAQIDAESSWNPNNVGPMTRYGTAKGIAQFMDGTKNDWGVQDPFNPQQAIEGMAKFMAYNLKKNGNDPAKALAAYNAGQGNVNNGKYLGFKETQGYIKKILRNAGYSGGQPHVAPQPQGNQQSPYQQYAQSFPANKNGDPYGDPYLTGERVITDKPKPTSIDPGVKAGAVLQSVLTNGALNADVNGDPDVTGEKVGKTYKTPDAPHRSIMLRPLGLDDAYFEKLPFDMRSYQSALDNNVTAVLGRDGRIQVPIAKAIGMVAQSSGLPMQYITGHTKTATQVEEEQQAAQEQNIAQNIKNRNIKTMRGGGFKMMAEGIEKVQAGIGTAADVVSNNQMQSTLSQATQRNGQRLTPKQKQQMMAMYGQKAMAAVGTGGMAAGLAGAGALSHAMIQAGFNGDLGMGLAQAGAQLADPTIDGDDKKEILKSQALNLGMMLLMGQAAHIGGAAPEFETGAGMRQRLFGGDSTPHSLGADITNGELMTRAEIEHNLINNGENAKTILGSAPEGVRDRVFRALSDGDIEGAKNHIIDWAQSENAISHITQGNGRQSIASIRDSYLKGNTLHPSQELDLHSQIPDEVHAQINDLLSGGDFHGAEKAYNDYIRHNVSDVPLGDDVHAHLNELAEHVEHQTLKDAFTKGPLNDSQHQSLFDRMPQNVKDEINLHYGNGDTIAAKATLDDWFSEHFGMEKAPDAEKPVERPETLKEPSQAQESTVKIDAQPKPVERVFSQGQPVAPRVSVQQANESLASRGHAPITETNHVQGHDGIESLSHSVGREINPELSDVDAHALYHSLADAGQRMRDIRTRMDDPQYAGASKRRAGAVGRRDMRAAFEQARQATGDLYNIKSSKETSDATMNALLNERTPDKRFVEDVTEMVSGKRPTPEQIEKIHSKTSDAAKLQSDYESIKVGDRTVDDFERGSEASIEKATDKDSRKLEKELTEEDLEKTCPYYTEVAKFVRENGI